MMGSLSLSDYARGPGECAPEYASLWEGLVGCWVPQMGPTGDTLLDLSGYGNHGTLTNMDPATDWVPGPDGWALDFDSYGDVIAIPHGATTTIGLSDFTLVFTALLRSVGIYKPGWFDSRDKTASYSGWCFARYNDTSAVEIQLRSNNQDKGFTFAAGNGLSLNQWQTHAIVVQRSSTALYYVDGMHQSSNNVSSASGVNVGLGGSQGIRIFQQYTNTHGADAQMAFAALYKRALLPSEVIQICDPLCFLRPRRRWWAVDPAAAGVYRARRYHDRLFAPGLSPGVM